MGAFALPKHWPAAPNQVPCLLSHEQNNPLHQAPRDSEEYLAWREQEDENNRRKREKRAEKRAGPRTVFARRMVICLSYQRKFSDSFFPDGGQTG